MDVVNVPFTHVNRRRKNVEKKVSKPSSKLKGPPRVELLANHPHRYPQPAHIRDWLSISRSSPSSVE